MLYQILKDVSKFFIYPYNLKLKPTTCSKVLTLVRNYKPSTEYDINKVDYRTLKQLITKSVNDISLSLKEDVIELELTVSLIILKIYLNS